MIIDYIFTVNLLLSEYGTKEKVKMLYGDLTPTQGRLQLTRLVRLSELYLPLYCGDLTVQMISGIAPGPSLPICYQLTIVDLPFFTVGLGPGRPMTQEPAVV